MSDEFDDDEDDGWADMMVETDSLAMKEVIKDF